MSLAQVHASEAQAVAASVEPERDLIERAKHDPEAFGLLYQRNYPMLVDHVFRRTGDMHATEDLVGDVFLIAIQSLRGYRPRGVPIRFWLLRIATNVVNRWARRRRRRTAVSLEPGQLANGTVSSTHGQVDSEHVQRAMLSLPPRFQAVLSLHHLEGLSVKETAEVLGCREGTVRSRLTRARDALRERLNRRR
ncbi:MAG: RNA polymerase sigma factor [Phycisphaerae bacterium]|nr:RNA polymerase sigma factor [Phycisphaerae bacterium]